ncbi:ComEC/Rec2 family competence protein [Streptomyces sp. NPDC057429]|uniref:ComEC/Rec2 family competence protein n=1 Tax=Streptomyces sp. NPDC057429 TaxID=3346130 RepID=UPI0036817729
MTDAACLEVHFINVGQGDSVLVVNRDVAKVGKAISAAGKQPPGDPIDWVPFAVAQEVSLGGTAIAAMLVDGGDDVYGNDVVQYLECFGVLIPGTVWTPHLSIVVSHYHDDHMAGLRYVFKKPVAPQRRGEQFSSVERYRPGKVYRTARDPQADPKTVTLELFEGDLLAAKTPLLGGGHTEDIYIWPGGRTAAGSVDPPLVIALGRGIDNIPIQATVLAAAQEVYVKGEGYQRIASVGRKPDQNDRSVVLVLEYGDFRCFLGGDIAGNGVGAGGNVGDNAANMRNKRFSSVHADVETTVERALGNYYPRKNDQSGQSGHCTVLKGDHHGSSTSMDVNLLARIRPCVAVISAGVKTRFHSHPSKEALRRVSNATPDWFLSRASGSTTPNTVSQNVYLTEMADRYKRASFTADQHQAKIMGDVVVRPLDASIRNGPVKLQIYGSGVRTELANDGQTLLRATVPVSLIPMATYPIGPFTVTDSS